jgi:hypothetical protein
MKVEEGEEEKERSGENIRVDEDAEGREEDEMGQENLTLLVRFCYDSPFYGRSVRLSNILVAVLGSVQEEFSYIIEVGSACERSVSCCLQCDPGVPRLQSASCVSTHRFGIELLL